jgi:hypothetical protein
MVRIDFVRDGNGLRLDPNPAPVTFQDHVRFFNLDPVDDHQIFGEFLPRLRNNNPAVSSPIVVTQGFDYACELHPEERGQVTLATVSAFTASALPAFGPPDRHARIAARAYELYLARGCAHGHDLEDWLAAERELSGRPPSHSPRPNLPPSNRGRSEP